MTTYQIGGEGDTRFKLGTALHRQDGPEASFEPVRMGRKDLAVLRMLCEHACSSEPTMPLSAQELRDRVWSCSVAPGSLYQAIRRLRQMLGHGWIETGTSDSGYRLAVPVRPYVPASSSVLKRFRQYVLAQPMRGLFSRAERNVEDLIVEIELIQLDRNQAFLEMVPTAPLQDLLTRAHADGGRPRCLVIGDPGSGKSTLAVAVARRLAMSSEGPLGIYLEVSQLARERLHPFDLCQRNFSEQEGQRTGGSLEEELRRIADDDPGGLWLLLDGLDKVSRPDQEWIQWSLRRWAEQLPNVVFAVFSRPIDCTHLVMTFSSYARLAPLSPEKQRELLERWLVDADQAIPLLRQVEGSPTLRQVAEQPLSLSMVAVIVNEARNRAGSEGEESLPASKLDLFEGLLELLLRSEAPRRNVVLEDPECLREVLEEFCLELCRQGSPEMPWRLGYLRQVMSDLCSRENSVARLHIGHDRPDRIRELFEQLAHSGILAPDYSSPAGRHEFYSLSAQWRFLHQQFLEVLAAKRICTVGDTAFDDIAGSIVGSDDIARWSEIVHYACELSSKRRNRMSISFDFFEKLGKFDEDPSVVEARKRMRIFFELGSVKFSYGAPRQAVGWIDRGLEVAQELGDSLGIGLASAALGWAWYLAGEPRQGIEAVDKGWLDAERSGDEPIRCILRIDKAWCHLALGDYEEAVRSVEDALSFAVDTVFPWQRTIGQVIRALCCAGCGDPERADALLAHEDERAAACELRADVYFVQALIAFLRGDSALAERRVNKCRAEAARVFDHGNGVRVMGLEAGLALRNRNFAKARKSLDQWVANASQSEYKRGEALARWHWGLYEVVYGEDPDRGRGEMRALVDYFDAIQHRLADTCRLISQCEEGDEAVYANVFAAPDYWI